MTALGQQIPHIRATANDILTRLSADEPPSFPELTAMSTELRGRLEELIDALAEHCPADQRDSTTPAVREALYWKSATLGSEPQPAVDCTRNLADITLILCGHHDRVIGG
jgi:hypothetical protein